MNLALAVGAALTVVGLAGYAVGVVVTYPGRAFSLTAIMVGLTVMLVSRGKEDGV